MCSATQELTFKASEDSGGLARVYAKDKTTSCATGLTANLGVVNFNLAKGTTADPTTGTIASADATTCGYTASVSTESNPFNSLGRVCFKVSDPCVETSCVF